MRPRYGAKPKKKKKDTNGTNGAQPVRTTKLLGPSLPKKEEEHSAFSRSDRAMMRMLTSSLRENSKVNENRLTMLIEAIEAKGYEVEWVPPTDEKAAHWLLYEPEDPVVRQEPPQEDEPAEDDVESNA